MRVRRVSAHSIVLLSPDDAHAPHATFVQDHRVYGAFMAKRQGDVVQIESFQQGVFRTNCIDCLDRSNVVQVSLHIPSIEA
jgi:hypothetical protein